MGLTSATARMYLEITNPGVNEDSAAGYEVGNFWYNNITGEHFQANSVNVGAAIWDKTVISETSAILSSLTIGTAGSPLIISGTGAPGASHPKGSLYLRTDGSTVNDRIYVATDAVGGWTSIVTST